MQGGYKCRDGWARVGGDGGAVGETGGGVGGGDGVVLARSGRRGFFCVRVVCWSYGGFFGGERLGGQRDVQVAVLCVGSIAGLHTNGVGVSV